MIPRKSVDLFADAYRRGKTLEEIGEFAGVSRERIRQLLARRGITRKDGGQCVKTFIGLEVRKRNLKKRKDAHVQHYYGCTYDEGLALNGGRGFSDGLCLAYRQQKKSAQNRGIGWDLTFPEWVRIWTESGKINQRGRGKDSYCMSRKGDSGPYSVDNVEIVTISKNASDSYLTKPAYRRFGLTDPNQLSPRQKQIHQLLLSGLSQKEIALRTGIQAQTVRQHICCIKQKTGAYEVKYAQAA